MRLVSPAIFRFFRHANPAFLSLFLAIGATFGLKTVSRAQTFYWDGSTPITVQTTFDSEYESTGDSNGNGGNGNSPSIQIYPVGVTPTPTFTPSADGEIWGWSPAPAQNFLPSIGAYGVGGMSATTKTVTDSFSLVSASPGYYYFIVPAMIVQRAGGGSSGVNVAIESRWITIDSLLVTQQGVPPQTASPALPVVYVQATQPVATKGADNQLVFTFQRISNGGNYSSSLTTYYTVGGTAPGSDYTLGGASPITFAANSQTATLTVTPKNNGVYNSAESVVVTVASDHASQATYNPSAAPATGMIYAADRPPTVAFSTPGVVKQDATHWTLTVNAGQNYLPSIHATDPDANLRAGWIYKGTATPTSNTGVVIPFGSNYLSGASGDLSGFTESIYQPGQVVYSAWTCDTSGEFSPTATLTVTVVNFPPTDVFTTPGITSTGGNSWALTVPINTPVNVSAHLHDASGDLSSTIIDSIYDDPVHNYNGTPSYRILEQSISGGDADVSVAQQSWSTPGTYQFSSSAIDKAQQLSTTAHLTVTVIDQPPTIAWTMPGIVQYGTNPAAFTCAIIPGQTIAISAHATDPDGNLTAVYIDSAPDLPPAGPAFNYQSATNGSATDVSSNFVTNTPGDQWFTARALDACGQYSTPIYLLVHVDAPPQVAWNGLGGWGQSVGPITISVGQSVTVDPIYQDSDAAGNARLVDAWAWFDGGVTGTFPPAGDNSIPVGSENLYSRPYNGNGVFAPTIPGTYTFHAAVSDGMVQPPTIDLTVVVQNQPPTIAWAVSGAYPVPGQPTVWELDLQGAANAPTIAATGVDPENRLASVLINRGTGDPTYGQGTPFAASATTSASAVMTADEMLPPLSTTLDSAVWEQANQDNYSWFSAGSTDQDGGRSAPIHLLVRVFNRAPSNAAWLSPAGITPVSSTDGVVTVYPNQAAFALSSASSDPEHKMWVALLNAGYVTPVAGNAAGNELNAGYASDGITATTAYTPGASTFDTVGDHWFSSVGIDKGQMYSGGTTPVASHLDVKVVNRPPVASFVNPVTSGNVKQAIAIGALGTDPDNAMLRTQSVVVSAPSASGYAAGQVLADATVPAARQVYPSNVPTWEADATLTPLVGGTYVVRSYVWDRHGGTAQADLTISVTDRPPVFTWTQASVHVLAGTAAQLPFTLADPDGDLNIATATGPGGYTQQLPFTNLATGSGSFTFPTTAAGTYTVTGAAFDLENTESVLQPTITVVVEAVDTPPVAIFTAPLPGGLTSTVTHFVDDVVAVSALGTDVDANLTSLNVSLGGSAWAQSPVSANVGSLNVGGSFTVPVLGAETSHTYVFTALATDAGTMPGGTITQTPKVSPAATLNIVVPNRPPAVVWTVPASPAGLTQATPFVGYLLQPLSISAQGTDRDGNLATVTITQVGNGNSVLGSATSADGRTALASYAFTPTVPGLYEFAAAATDKANATSGPVDLWVLVQDYPSDTTGTIGALVVSPASSLQQVFAAGALPIVVKGGVAPLGRTSNVLAISTGVATMGASQILPVPGYLDGTMMPPFSPPILDLRTQTVVPAVDHAAPATSNN